MKCFYQANTLYEDGKIIGYNGIDVETGELKSFSHYDSNNYYCEDMLFDYTLVPDLASFAAGNNKKQIVMDKIIEYSIQTISKYVDWHQRYNMEHNLPVDFLKVNAEHLNLHFDDIEDSYGFYMPIGNKITILFENMKKLKFNNATRKDIRTTSCHEVGHMKAASVSVDLKNRILNARVGFYTISYRLEPIKIHNGDIFFKVLAPISYKGCILGETLEEIINEEECFEIDKNYSTCVYNYGKLINELCNRKLNLARYNDGIDVYYECMTDLIPSESKAKELLYKIDVARKSDSFFQKENREVLKLVREYNKAKNRLK